MSIFFEMLPADSIRFLLKRPSKILQFPSLFRLKEENLTENLEKELFF